MAILREKVGITNEDIRKIRSMRPGRILDLQVSTNAGIKRVKTEFIGLDNRKCLIIKFPDESKWGGLRDAIYKNASLVMRYILEDETGEIIAFKVKVLLVATTPSDLIFTSFPLALQSIGLRAEERTQTNISISISNESGARLVSAARIIDISTQGCRIKIEKVDVSEKIPLGSTLTLGFSHNALSSKVLVGKIMSLKSDEVSWFFGMKFDTPESQVTQLLKDIMVLGE